jgi:hypothetical protein
MGSAAVMVAGVSTVGSLPSAVPGSVRPGVGVFTVSSVLLIVGPGSSA